MPVEADLRHRGDVRIHLPVERAVTAPEIMRREADAGRERLAGNARVDLRVGG